MKQRQQERQQFEMEQLKQEARLKQTELEKMKLERDRMSQIGSVSVLIADMPHRLKKKPQAIIYLCDEISESFSSQVALNQIGQIRSYALETQQMINAQIEAVKKIATNPPQKNEIRQILSLLFTTWQNSEVVRGSNVRLENCI